MAVKTIARCILVALAWTGAGMHQQAWAKQTHPRGAQTVRNSLGMEMVFVPPGEFYMGSKQSAEALARRFGVRGPKRFWPEMPQHLTTIGRGFRMSAREVTVGQFRQFVEASGYKTQAEGGGRPGAGRRGGSIISAAGAYVWRSDASWRRCGFIQDERHPVVMVSWHDAQAFCRWLSRKEGKTYRLPTEAEWEYACRGGTETAYWWGELPDREGGVANVCDRSTRRRWRNWTGADADDGFACTAPVGTYRPNALGLHDMIGNVAEWCQDWYEDTYNLRLARRGSPGPARGTQRVTRGGSWSVNPCGTRSASRNCEKPDGRLPNLGFRVVQEVPAPPSSDGGMLREARRLVEFHRRRGGIPAGFTVAVTGRFIVIGDESPQVVRRRAATLVATTAQRLKARFGKELDVTWAVYMFRSRESYLKWVPKLFPRDDVFFRRTRGRLPDGFISPARRLLVMDIAWGEGNLVHEMTHCYVRTQFSQPPMWLNEGLATLYESSAMRDGRLRGTVVYPYRLDNLKKDIRAGRLPTIRQLTETRIGDFKGVHYDMSRYLCVWLQERGLLETFFRRCVANQHTDPRSYQSLKSVLGVDDLNAFRARWAKWVLRLGEAAS